MPDQPNQPSAFSAPDAGRGNSAHEAHDPLVIAALAGDDLTGTELTNAIDLAASCSDCAELLADLRSIMAATVEMPVPARTRDFRLTEEDARRLHPGRWRQVVGFLAGPRLAFTQPVAAGLTTIGLAGLLLFSLQGFGSSAAAPLSVPGNASASTQERTQATSAPTGASGASAAASSASGVHGPGPAMAPSPGGSGGPTAPTQLYGDNAASGPEGKTASGSTGPADSSTPAAADGTRAFSASSPGGPPLIVVLSGLAVLLGVALLLMRWTARRLVGA